MDDEYMEFQDERRYRSFVEDAMLQSIKEESARVFGNRGINHARVVMDIVLENTSESLDIVTGALSDEVFDFELFSKMLDEKPEVKVRILIDGSSAGGRSILPSLEEVYPGRLDVRYLSDYNKPDVHLCVSDNKFSRLEVDKENRVANVAFWHHEFAETGTEMFDRFWEIAMEEPQHLGALELSK